MERLQQIEPEDGGKRLPQKEEENVLSQRPRESEDFAVMDCLDEQLIQRDLDGILQDELVYQFEMSGRQVVGLTAFGAIALARSAVQQFDYSIKCDKPIIEDRRDSIKASCKVTFQSPRGNVLELWGSKVQSKKIILRDGKDKENENAEIIAETKALRNAILKIFPPKQTAQFILSCFKEGKVKRVSTNEVKEALERTKSVGAGPAKPASPSTATAQTKLNGGRKLIKYFETSQRETVKVPVGTPLYDEFVEWCAVLKNDHPEVEYSMRRDPSDSKMISSVMWENIQAGGELEKAIDNMMTSIADGVVSIQQEEVGRL